MKRLSFLCVLLCISCANQEQVGYSHLLSEKEIKSKQTDKLPISFHFFQETTEDCNFFFQLDPTNFLAMRDSLGLWSVEMAVELKIKSNSLGSSVFIELLKDTVLSSKDILKDSLRFTLPERKDVFAEIVVLDKNKHVHQSYYYFWERDMDFIPESLLLWDSKSNSASVDRFVELGNVLLRTQETLSTQMTLDIYQNIFSPAEKMYFIGRETKKELFTPVSSAKGSILELSEILNELKVESYCRIKPIETGEKNKTKSFDFTLQPSFTFESILPLTYFLSEQEEPRKEVNFTTWVQFWTKASGNNDRKAEVLIKEFHRRVMFANDFYSSYKLGWQTDRGMMYLLFGPPDRIQEDVRGEIWMYGFTDVNAKQFLFYRNPNSLNRNDYVLERNINYRDFWQSAIVKWENGWINGNGN